jgi:hypothetical protein
MAEHRLPTLGNYLEIAETAKSCRRRCRDAVTQVTHYSHVPARQSSAPLFRLTGRPTVRPKFWQICARSAGSEDGRCGGGPNGKTEIASSSVMQSEDGCTSTKSAH